ncbi:MAG TPA: ABC transporter substrate-binding protein [Tepidiformaceae bacterium]|nr:ABC transporter substrate-binding protein [Tepidiformaceae bacterium]
MANPHARSRRPVILAATFVAAVLAASAALALRVSGNESVVLAPSSTYAEGIAGTWQRVNPLFVSSNEVDADLSALVFSGLVRLASDGRVIPDLADLPEVSSDGRTYTFRLRDNARWHAGEPVTSIDVELTINQIKDPDFRDPLIAEGWIGTEVETPDERTVIVRLRQSSAPFLARSATVGILPEHLLRGTTAQQMVNTPFNAAPVGSGPYRVSLLNSQEARLTSHERYHLGRPNIDRITLRFYTDYSTAVQALTRGDVDGLLVRDNLTAEQQAEIAGNSSLTTTSLLRSSQTLLYLNTSNVFFRDELTRRAISLALDRQALASGPFLGRARPSSSPVTPDTWAYAASADDIEQNLTDARLLLEEAGWIPNPTNGVLARQGSEFRFAIRVDNDPVRVAVAERIASQLEPIGIRASVVSTTFSVLRRDFLQERNYEAALASWEQGPDPDIYFGWHSSQLGAAGLNLANFEDAVIDELISRGRTSMDPGTRLDSYTQIQEVWQVLSPGVVVAYRTYEYVQTRALQDAHPGVLFTPSNRFVDVHKWRR